MTIRELREAKGLSQGEFAESIGIGRTSVVGYEKGKFRPKRQVIEKIQEVYGVTVEEAAAAEASPIAKEKKPAKRGRKKKEAPAAPAAQEEKADLPASAIKALRKRQGLSQKAFAASIGVKTPTVCAYEQGRIKPSGAVIAKIKEAYGANALSMEPQPAREAVPAKADKPKAKRGRKKAAALVIQSPLGGAITPEEILAKIGPADTVYVRVDENKAYWVRGDESGSVDLW